MTHTATDDRLRKGTVIEGRYTVDRLLGSGGFANVYLAQHNMLGTDVAIKVLHSPLASASDPQFAERFEREAKVAAQMRHPNVVGVTDFGFLDEGGDPYIVMEYLEGRDLEEELKSFGTVDPQRLRKLMIPCIRAVNLAHDQGVVHKDLKPSNLFIVDAGKSTERLVVLDFGVARVFDEADANITQTGAFTGTPAYLPPEYIREQIVTPAFDVYQMGLIVIESLTGRRAVEADGPMGFLLAHCMGRLSVDESFFESPFGQVIRRAISVDDEQRFPTCGALAQALEKVEWPPSNYDAAAFLTDGSAPTNAEVAAFADTVSSGQIVGDSFVTGAGAQAAQSGDRMPQSGSAVPKGATPHQSFHGRPTAGLESSTTQSSTADGSRTVLYAVAGVLLLLIVGAAAGVVVLLGETDSAGVAAGADAGSDVVIVEGVAGPGSVEDGIEVLSGGLEDAGFVMEEMVEPDAGLFDEEGEFAGAGDLPEETTKPSEKAQDSAKEEPAPERKPKPVAKKRVKRTESKPKPKKDEKEDEEEKTRRLFIVD